MGYQTTSIFEKSGDGKIDVICVHLLVFSLVAVSQRVNSPDQLSDHVSCLHCPSELQCVNTSRASGPRDAQEDWSPEVLSWWQMASCLLTARRTTIKDLPAVHCCHCRHCKLTQTGSQSSSIACAGAAAEQARKNVGGGLMRRPAKPRLTCLEQ